MTLRLVVLSLLWALAASGQDIENNILHLEDFKALDRWSVAGLGEVQCRTDTEGPYLEWQSERRGETSMTLDLSPHADELSQYQTICFEYQQAGENAHASMALHRLPTQGISRNWYFKFSRRPGSTWRTARFELRMGDDLPQRQTPPTTELRLAFATVNRHIMGPAILRIRNLRLVRHPMRMGYVESRTVGVMAEAGYRYAYRVTVQNVSKKPRTGRFVFDRSGLQHFRLIAPEDSITLGPNKYQIITPILEIPKDKLTTLPPLHMERVPFTFRVDGIRESDTAVMRGWRVLPLIAAVPPRYDAPGGPRIRTTAARLSELAAAPDAKDPKTQQAIVWLKKRTAATLSKPGFYPRDQGSHNMGFTCPSCKQLLALTPPDGVRCDRCDKEFKDNQALLQAGIIRHHIHNAQDAYYCALLHAITGEDALGERAKEILMAYTDNAANMSIQGSSLTGYNNVFGDSLYMESHLLPLAWTYDMLRGTALLEKGDIDMIRKKLLHPMLNRFSRHHTSYTSGTMTYKLAQMSFALASDRWEWAAQAVHGDFGLYDMLAHGFNEAGWATYNYFDQQSAQNLIVHDMALLAEAAQLAGTAPYTAKKLEPVLRHAGLAALADRRYNRTGQTAPTFGEQYTSQLQFLAP